MTAPEPVSFEALHARYEQDAAREDATGATALAHALERATWPANAPMSAAEVGQLAWGIVYRCVFGRWEVTWVHHQLAELLSHAACGPGEELAPAAAFQDMAAAVLRAYVTAPDPER